MGFVQKKKENPQLSQMAFITMIVLVMTTTTCCGAAVLVKSSTMYECSGGLISGRRVAEEMEMEMELMMDSTVIRILQEGSGNIGVNALNGNQPAVNKCPPGKGYAACMAKGNGNGKNSCNGSSTYCR